VRGMKPTEAVAWAGKALQMGGFRRDGMMSHLLGVAGGQTCGNLPLRAGFTGISHSAEMQVDHDLASFDNKKVLFCRSLWSVPGSNR
jgi:hypothetical protein